MTGKVVAIHQPNLFPWLGFFSKMMRSDIFVFLDHTLNNPRTSIYTKTVKIITNRSEFWLVIPLKNKKDQTFVRVRDMEIDNPGLVAKKQLKTFDLNYRKAPYYGEVLPLLTEFYESSSCLITERNINFICKIAGLLGIAPVFVRSSELNHSGQSTEMLISLIKELGGSTYLSGDGAEGYQQEYLYLENKIDLKFSNFQHPVYPQFSSDTFFKGLSIIDPLMNLGFEGTKRLLTSSLLL
jgi:hypothetical protein